MNRPRTLAAAALLAAAAAALPGCLLVAGAAVGAGIVHVTGEDEAVVALVSRRGEAWDASRAVLSERGLVESADAERGLLEGTIGSSSVEIRVEERSEGGSRVVVSARRNAGLSPDVVTAQQTATGILARCP